MPILKIFNGSAFVEVRAGLDTETTQDIVGAMVTGGADCTVTYNDGAGTLSISVDSTVLLADGTRDITGIQQVQDDVRFAFGNNDDAFISWATSLSNDYLAIGVAVGVIPASGFVSLMVRGHETNAKRNPDVATNPTFRIWSADLTSGDWIQFYHDKTDGIIEVGNGTTRIRGNAGDLDLRPNNVIFEAHTTASGAVGFTTLTAARTWDFPDTSGVVLLQETLSLSVDDLSDVSLSGATTGQVLTFTTTGWVNASVAAGGGGMSGPGSSTIGALAYFATTSGDTVAASVIHITTTGMLFPDSQNAFFGTDEDVSFFVSAASFVVQVNTSTLLDITFNGDAGVVNHGTDINFNAGGATGSQAAGSIRVVAGTSSSGTAGLVFISGGGSSSGTPGCVMLNDGTNRKTNFATTTAAISYNTGSAALAVSATAITFNSFNGILHASTGVLLGSAAVDDLSDVSIASAATGQVLTFTTTGWVNASISSAVNPTEAKFIYIESVTSTDSFPIGFFPAQSTIVKVFGEVDAGSVSFNIEQRAFGGADTSGTDIDATEITATTAGHTLPAASITNPTIAADSWMHLAISSAATATTKLWVAISYTVD